MPIRNLVALTVAVAVVVAVSIRVLSPDQLSAFGSILSGGGSLLAVLWFSAGLRYQANQIEEQRKQFEAQFKYLQESSRRDALMVAKDILEKAERDAIALNGKITHISELLTEYTNFSELKPLLESTNASEVLRAHSSWMKKEGAALQLLQGIKSAAEIYMRSAGTPGVDYSKPPDEFYMIYSVHFSSLPYFQAVSGVAHMLSEFMFRIGPGRNAALIAFFAASAKSISPDIIKMDKLRADMAKHVQSGHPLPAIAKEV